MYTDLHAPHSLRLFHQTVHLGAWAKAQVNDGRECGQKRGHVLRAANHDADAGGQPDRRCRRQALYFVTLALFPDGGCAEETDARRDGGRHTRRVPGLRPADEGKYGGDGEAARTQRDDGHRPNAGRPVAAASLPTDDCPGDERDEDPGAHVGLPRRHTTQHQVALVATGIREKIFVSVWLPRWPQCARRCGERRTQREHRVDDKEYRQRPVYPIDARAAAILPRASAEHSGNDGTALAAGGRRCRGGSQGAVGSAKNRAARPTAWRRRRPSRRAGSPRCGRPRYCRARPDPTGPQHWAPRHLCS
eukprot:scaffold4824_cov145-Isochrysis_galbana.AAC.6